MPDAAASSRTGYRFVDESGNYFEAECASTNCPDSGIPGRRNQAARFDGGVADDDGNDGGVDHTLASEFNIAGNQLDINVGAYGKRQSFANLSVTSPIGGTTVANGATLGLQGDINLSSEDVTLVGAGDGRVTSDPEGIDCGLGNLRSVQKALEHVTPQVRILSAPADVATVRSAMVVSSVSPLR